MHRFHMAASNYKNFFPTIVETLGFSRNVTLALTCPPYLISGIISIAWAASSGLFSLLYFPDSFHSTLATSLLFRLATADGGDTRPFQRKGLAYHSREMRCRFWFRTSLQHAQHWWSLLRYVYLCDWCLCLQQRNPRLGINDMRPDQGEKGYFACYGQYYCHHFLDFYSGKLSIICIKFLQCKTQANCGQVSLAIVR